MGVQPTASILVLGTVVLVVPRASNETNSPLLL
jgi:hypothetical protein